MWRKLWLVLVIVRLYFAFNPTYIHPDEHFQGPEVIAGEVFGWPTHRTWEFTSPQPIRSFFPLWLIYGLPLTLLKWIWEGLGYGHVPPIVAFYTLRLMMFVLSFVLEDWAIHELIPNHKDRRVAITLIASSYVTWTFQTHTFSNSIETLIVLWCLVLISRIRDDRDHNQTTACIVLAFLGVLGVFNRITFPAFIVIPATQLLPHLLAKPLRILILTLAGLTFLASAILLDTSYYHRLPIGSIHFRDLPNLAIFTPYNNFLYNLDPANLATHGLHPYHQHFAANLPQLLGPAILLLPFHSSRSTLFWTALTGIALLSIFQHQEPRFLLPAIPLLISSARFPRRYTRAWLALWITFNAAAGVIFGTYHQGGVVPAQTWLASQGNVAQVFWWKTYSPPRWLLDGRNADILTVDLMGTSGPHLLKTLVNSSLPCPGTAERGQTLLVAPASATFLDDFVGLEANSTNPVVEEFGLEFEELWRYRRHIGLDDLDFGDDGVWPTLERVVGRRGLVVWDVTARKGCQMLG